MLFISKILSSILQICLFTIIPFIWWFVSARKEQTFFQWIGLKKCSAKRNNVRAWTIGTALVFLILGIFVLYILKNVETAASEFAGLGVPAIPAILIYAVFNTALPEELLFRGFLLKRVSHKFGFIPANSVQALMFGLLHGIMFFSFVKMTTAVLIIAFTSAIAWLMGYINEKKAGGSIYPGWIIHSVSNVVSGLCAAFLII